MTNIFRVSTLVIVLGLATLVQAQSLPTPYNFTDSLDGAQPDASVVPALLASDKERVLWKFNGADGGRPQGTLIFDAVGNLYGTTAYAGANGEGNVFELSPQPSGKWTKTVLYSFCPDRYRCADGANPVGVIIDSSGNLYGMTSGGGSGNGYGVVFELTPSADAKWTEQVLYSFQGNETWPPGGPVLDRSRTLIRGTPVWRYAQQ